MNFLAHLHLAQPNPTSRLGNLLGDFVRGRPDERFSPELWRGIMHHRRLDAFTDAHPAWKLSRGRLDPSRRRFAGIIVDVFYDHFLSRHWERFGPPDQDLEAFVASCHHDLLEAAPQGPADAIQVLKRMKRQQWLISYRHLDGIEGALQRMARRSSRFAPMALAGGDLKAGYDDFESDFLRFYPEAIDCSNALHRESDGGKTAL